MSTNQTGLRSLLPQLMFVMIFAAVVAAAVYLLFRSSTVRADFPPGTRPITVGDTTVLIRADPEQEVFLVPLDTGTSPEGTGGQVQEPEERGGGDDTAILPTVAPTPTPNILPSVTPAPPAVDPVIFIDYQVRSGDTLYSISTRQDTSISLMARYGISSVDMVPGRVIRLPIGNPAYCPGNLPYAVAEGETAFSIAVKCGTTVQVLQQLNNLDANFTIYSASIICVPGP